MIPIVTIDGPSGSGKGTLAAKIAAHYGYHLLDSGALYRILALAALGMSARIMAGESTVEADLAGLVSQLVIEFTPNPSGLMVRLNGSDVSSRIREEDIGLLASKIAVFPSVRQALLKQQRCCVQLPGLVADGRDMGTVVFPQAQFKFFLTASSQARAERRLKQLQDRGIDANLCTILQDLQARDARDAERAVAPLVAAADATHIDASTLSIVDVFALMCSVIDAAV